MNVKQWKIPDCYNTYMSGSAYLFHGLIILIPLIGMSILNTAPVPDEIARINREINSISANGSDHIEDLTLLLQYQPWRSDLWERLGREYLDKEEYAASINAFQIGESSKDLSSDGKIAWADALISSGDYESAKEMLRTTASSQNNLINFIQIIALQRSIGDVYGAEGTLLFAHHLFPENEEISFQLGLMLSTTQPDSAIQFLSEPQNLRQNDSLLKNVLIATIEETSNSVSSSDRFLQIGQVLSTFGEWDVAAQAFESTLAYEPNSALGLAYLGEAKQQLGQDGSVEIIRALDLAPENEIVNGLTGLYYRREEKNDLSLLYLDKAVRINPSESVWVIEKSRTYEQMGDLENAYKLLMDAVNLSPEDYSTWKALSFFSITHNYEVKETGIAAARKALSLNPSSSVLADLLGTGLMLTEDYDSAERFFLQALALDPRQSAILIHLGQLKILQKNFEEARNYLQQAIEYAPNNRLRDLAIQLMNENTGE
jgi:tetratricopeptide (TPR) repeat protein